MAPGANPPTAVMATIMMNHAAATTYAIAFVGSVTCAKPTSTATSMTAMAERNREPMMSNMAILPKHSRRGTPLDLVGRHALLDWAIKPQFARWYARKTATLGLRLFPFVADAAIVLHPNKTKLTGPPTLARKK